MTTASKCNILEAFFKYSLWTNISCRNSGQFIAQKKEKLPNEATIPGNLKHTNQGK
jgi:hypothetical protein